MSDAQSKRFTKEERAALKERAQELKAGPGHNGAMADWPAWVEEMFEPIRRRSVEANAPLVKELGVSRADLKRMVSLCRERPDLVSPGLRRAVAITALRGATRL